MRQIIFLANLVICSSICAQNTHAFKSKAPNYIIYDKNDTDLDSTKMNEIDQYIIRSVDSLRKGIYYLNIEVPLGVDTARSFYCNGFERAIKISDYLNVRYNIKNLYINVKLYRTITSDNFYDMPKEYEFIFFSMSKAFCR